MHWYCDNDAVRLLNEVTSQIFQLRANFKIFKIHLYFVSLLVCQPAVRPGVGLQKFHMIKVMAADLQKYCPENDLLTLPW